MTPYILLFFHLHALYASGYSFAGTSRMERKTIPDSPVTENESFFRRPLYRTGRHDLEGVRIGKTVFTCKESSDRRFRFGYLMNGFFMPVATWTMRSVSSAGIRRTYDVDQIICRSARMSIRTKTVGNSYHKDPPVYGRKTVRLSPALVCRIAFRARNRNGRM